jgi:hypothetical protein
MTAALEKAYASNTATPLHTLEFLHSAITGGALRLVQGYEDIEATLEDSSVVTFSASGFGLALPERGTDGKQDLRIQLDNVSLVAYDEIKAAKTATRTTEEKIICKYRPFLESDLSAPAGATFVLTVTRTAVTRSTVSVNATYTPIPEVSWPVKRYYTTEYPGLKYVG